MHRPGDAWHQPSAICTVVARPSGYVVRVKFRVGTEFLQSRRAVAEILTECIEIALDDITGRRNCFDEILSAGCSQFFAQIAHPASHGVGRRLFL